MEAHGLSASGRASVRGARQLLVRRAEGCILAALLYLVGSFAALAYAGTVVVLARQGGLLPALTANPLWLLVAVVSLGLGRLVALAEAANGTLRRLDGWRSEAGSRIGVRGKSVAEVLEQVRDRLPPKADAEPGAAADRPLGPGSFAPQQGRLLS
jgi:hypothetical protein